MTPDGVVERLVILLGVDVQKNQFKAATDAAGNLAAAVLGAAGAIAMLVRSTAAAGDEVLATARKVQVSTDALTEFYHVADDLGSSNEAVVAGFRFLSRNIGEAAEKSGEARDAFRKIGLSVADLKRMSLDQVLTVASDGFRALATDAERTRLAMQLFGRGGVELLPVLMAGSAEIEELRKQARELGLVWRQEDAEAADKLNDSIGRLTGIGGGLARRFAIDLIPTFQRLADSAEEWWKANREIILQRLDRTAADIARAFGALNTPLGMTVALLTALAGAKVAANLASTIPVVGQLMGALAPVAGYAAAAGLLYLAFDDFRTAAEGGDSAVGRLADKMGVGGEFDAALRNTKGLLEESAAVLPTFISDIGDAFMYAYEAVSGVVSAITDMTPTWLIDLLKLAQNASVRVATGGMFGADDLDPRSILNGIAERTSDAAAGFQAYRRVSAAAESNPAAARAVEGLRYATIRRSLPFGSSTPSAGEMGLQRVIRNEIAPTANVTVNLQGDRLAPGDAEQIRRSIIGGLSDAAAEFP